MADENYTLALVYVDDALLAQEASVSLRRASGSSPVETTALGYAGESPGSPMCEIDISNAVPSSDFELDPGPFIATLKRCKVTIFAAGRKYSSRGQITEDNFQHATNSQSKLEFKFRGKMGQWEGV